MSTAFQIREATITDVPALAQLHVDTFIETHGGFRPPTFALREQQWREAFTAQKSDSFCFVAEEDDKTLVGFGRGTPHDGGVPGYEGELNKIYVLKRCHRRGLGRLLVLQVAKRFLEQDVTSMLLFGDRRSRANGFYEHLGAERLLTEKGEFHGGYGWRDLRNLVDGYPKL